MLKDESWEAHYGKEKSELIYPDENLVRLLKKNLAGLGDTPKITAVDLGCGSGRHLKLLGDLGISNAIGLDPSAKALAMSRRHYPGTLLQGNNKQIPIRDQAADIVIAWGSLHYNSKDDLKEMVDEIHRILKPDGFLFATLRSSRDTYLKKGKHIGNDTWITDLSDIQGSMVSFYEEHEMRTAFSIFTEFSYGLMERTLIGELSSLISHWIIEARP
ncbi:MAG: class I SAM-dependent methyltransferase [Spirochaetes bacterium]|nr:class I SAM-dependent methyltransferase [Spirochaetota bacterium]